MIAFYHDKDIDLLNLGCTLPKLAKICLHKSTDAKFFLFTEGDKDLLEKIWEDVVGAPSIVFTLKAVVDETFIRKSTNICKSVIGIDASQLYTYSMSQPMPTGFHTRWDIDSETSRFISRQNETRNFENMFMSYFQRKRPDCKIESFYITGRQKKINRFSVDGFCSHCYTAFEAMGCFHHFCSCQKLRPSLTEEDNTRGSRKENSMNWDEAIQKRKVSLSLEYGNVSGRDFRRQPLRLNYISERIFLTDDHLQNNNS